jgi:hypothetical protein
MTWLVFSMKLLFRGLEDSKFDIGLLLIEVLPVVFLLNKLLVGFVLLVMPVLLPMLFWNAPPVF